MPTHDLMTGVGTIAGAMALAALLEAVVPLRARPVAGHGRCAGNLGLTALTLIANAVLGSAVAIVALAPLGGAPGLMTGLGMPRLPQLAASVALLDLGFGYVAHRAMHLSPTLWRVHRVHHADPFVDVTTTYRTHPIESAWRMLFVIVPVWALGIPAQAVVLHRVLSALNAILEHANIRLWQPADALLSLLWVTPQMHKVHHSRRSEETDTNYGNLLAIFDRVLGTFTPSRRAFAVTYGLGDDDPSSTRSLGSLLAMPFRGLPLRETETMRSA